MGFALLSLVALSASAQDTLKLKSGSLKRVQILNINDESVHFKPTPESPNAFYFAKSDIEEIWFGNGKKEKILHPELTEEELKLKATTLLQTNAHLKKSKNPIQVLFDSNLLVLSEINPNDNKTIGTSKTYDLSKVFAFQPVSYRTGDFAFLNIVIMVRENDSANWEQQKLVLAIDHQEKAVLLLDVLKQLNEMLNQKNDPKK
ncbi:hypothetical protein SAMN04487935_3463 [Flavobacterium noncentrifugens]|uniref:Uncharacterized protein n=2 Tax=Flavobacterium noncentrifugens TaxID=1128970 RepID=A0A1G9CCA0_9FLAO|nr:hypothetical protein SAMN04487935_3463 [Flavobacterium noncentrifugens]